MNDPIDLKELFPDMEPVNGAPSVFNINGCGLMLYGRRDFDSNTGTYLTTQCLTLIFIPLLCLKTFRVADNANGGWAIIGREPMSWLAKGWSLLSMWLLAVGIGMAYWFSHTSSPEYIAGQKVEEAVRAEEAGDWATAMDNYQSVATGSTTHRSKALKGFERVIDNHVGTASLEDAQSMLGRAINLGNVSGQDFATRVIHDFTGKAVEAHRAEKPAECRALLKAVDPLIVKAKDPGESRKWVTTVSRELLESAVALPNPSVDVVVDLAMVLEEEGELERCETILQQRKDELGTTEGARILGQIYSRRSDVDNAYALLMPYMQVRLDRLKEVNESLESMYESAQQTAINALQNGQAPESFYTRYDAASEEQQGQMVGEFIMARVESNSTIKDLQAQIMELSGAIPAAIDLGILQLQRAQQESDANKRKQELEQAEKTFLAVRGQLGETDTYRLFLGQVYFWMDRQDEGRELFDKLLEENTSDEIQLQVASVYRQVGSVNEARELCEKVYEFSTVEKSRKQAAGLRAVMHTDVEDQIQWLSRGEQDTLIAKINLNWAKAQQAMQNGKDKEAIDLLRTVVAAYANSPETAAELNNEALAWFSLAELAEEPASFDRGLEKMERAMSLDPKNSLLLRNSTDKILQAAVRDVMKDKMDLAALRVEESIDLLDYVFTDKAGAMEIAAALQQHPGFRKSIENYEKLTVLAPRSVAGWMALNRIYSFLDDDEKLKSMATRLQQADLEMTDNARQLDKLKSGELDDRYKSHCENAIEANQNVIDERQTKADLTFTVAAGERIDANSLIDTIDGTVDHGADAELATFAFDAAPSQAMTRRIASTHAAAILNDLKAKSDVCRQFDKRHGRILQVETLLLMGLQLDRSLIPETKKHPRYAAFVEAVSRHQQNFPLHNSATRYLLMNVLSEKDIADEHKRRLLELDMIPVYRQIQTKLYPFAPSALMDSFWTHTLRKSSDEAAATLKLLAKIEPELAQAISK